MPTATTATPPRRSPRSSQRLGSDAEVVHDGATALAAFERFRPSAVLLDIGMPGMDGYEVARHIRQRANSTRVALVAVTGWGRDRDRALAREAGFDEHLVKPADLAALQSLLSALA
jgi:CheY-like chemotaxis protein